MSGSRPSILVIDSDRNERTTIARLLRQAGFAVVATARAEGAIAAVKDMPADFRVSIANAPGKDAYPISSFTWLLIPEKSKDPSKGKTLADFLNWMVDDGQKMTAELAYAPLPENVATKVKAAALMPM